MQININKEKFIDIEEAFTRLKANESDISALRTISDALHSLTDKNIVVDTVRPESKNQVCNVMSVYPEESTIDKIIEAIITEQNDSIIAKLWNDTGKWNIEIDTRILSKDVDLTEKELTALILHEVGHIVYSNSVPMRIARVLRFEYAKTSMATKQLLKDKFFSKLVSLPILNACNFNTSRNTIKTEIQADKYSIQSGYGKDLNSAIDKIIAYVGTDSNQDEEMQQLLGFSVDTLMQLQKRQNNIARRNIGYMIKSTPSKFAKKIVMVISNGLNGSNTPNSTVTEAVKDKYISDKIDSIMDSFYASEAFFNRVHKLKRIDPADIDYIGLEVNNIKSNDDKMMIVSYIYNKIDTIDYYLALIDSKNPKYVIPHSRESLVNMRNILEKYKNDAINRKLPEVNYGISIQYPTGYEG